MFLTWAEFGRQGERQESAPAESPEEMATAETRRRFDMVNSPILTETGTPYMYNEEDIDEIWQPPMPWIYLKRPWFKLPKSMEKATLQLERFIYWERCWTSREDQAKSRLESLVSSVENGTGVWGPDMIYKTFQDWDTLLFNGRLKGNVGLAWDTEDKMSNNEPGSVWGRVTPDGASLTRHFALIRLNAKWLLLPANNEIRVGEYGPSRSWVRGPFLVTLALLLHEMVPHVGEDGEHPLRPGQHAYLHVTTGTMHFAKDVGESEDPCESHCRYFRRCLHAVDTRARKLLGVRAAVEYSENRDLFDSEWSGISGPNTLWEKIVIKTHDIELKLRQFFLYDLKRIIWPEPNPWL
ncbi:MAG: hypothetical protein Q9167_001394 [Letrouitia subvulpina]